MILPLPLPSSSSSSSSLTTSPHLIFCVFLLPLRNERAALLLLLLLNLVMTMKANMKTKAVERAERASLELKGLATDRIDHPNVQNSTGRRNGWMDG